MLIELTQADAMAALYPDEEQGKESDQALESALEMQEEKEEKKEKKEKKDSAGNGAEKKDAEAEDAGSQL